MSGDTQNSFDKLLSDLDILIKDIGKPAGAAYVYDPNKPQRVFQQIGSVLAQMTAILYALANQPSTKSLKDDILALEHRVEQLSKQNPTVGPRGKGGK